MQIIHRIGALPSIVLCLFYASIFIPKSKHPQAESYVKNLCGIWGSEVIRLKPTFSTKAIGNENKTHLLFQPHLEGPIRPCPHLPALAWREFCASVLTEDKADQHECMVLNYSGKSTHNTCNTSFLSVCVKVKLLQKGRIKHEEQFHTMHADKTCSRTNPNMSGRSIRQRWHLYYPPSLAHPFQLDCPCRRTLRDFTTHRTFSASCV